MFRILSCLIAVALLAVAVPTTHADNKLNVVLILIDDMGWMDLSCQGSKYYETPHIDSLAAQGIRFTDGYAACAVCPPTRASVMTGQYPGRIRITDWIRARFQGGKVPANGKNPGGLTTPRKGRLAVARNPLWMEHDQVTIAEALKPAGYVSCHIGKWHLGPDDYYPTKQGFAFNYGGCDYGQPPSYFDPYSNGRLKQGIPTLKPRKEGEYLTDREGDEAVSFIKAHKDKPFFLYFANYAVHTPIQARKDITAKYEAKPKTNQKNAKYAAMVESVDQAVGKIIQTLEDEGLTDKTLIIFTSDNGGLSGPTNNQPLRAGKGYAYEGGIRVPVIVKWPGQIKAGSISEQPVISCDYMPTILEATANKPLAGQVIDGVSLVSHLKSNGSKALDREAIYWHFPHYRHKPGPYSIIRDGDFKLLKFYEGPKLELYNLRDDLSEKKDLASQMPEKVKALDAKLMAHLKSIHALIPRRAD
jgi:arylsulfatase A